jgi:hypothetical protein
MLPEFVKHIFVKDEHEKKDADIIKRLMSEKAEAIAHERRQTNALDAMALTLIAQAISEYEIEPNNPEWTALTLPKSIAIGASSWLGGELCETIYKKVYKKFTGRNLRDAMGQTKIFGITIDNQRLLRRIISLTILCIELYVLSQNCA